MLGVFLDTLVLNNIPTIPLTDLGTVGQVASIAGVFDPHKELGAQLLARVRDDLEEYGSVEQMPQMEGRQMVMVIAPKKH